MNLVKVDPKEFGLEPKNVESIEQAFLPKIAERKKKELVKEAELARIQKELEDKKRQEEEARIKAEKEESERIENELRKGDSDKMDDLIKDLKQIQSKYHFKSKSAKKAYLYVNIQIRSILDAISKTKEKESVEAN